MKDTYYFSHDYNARTDSKIIRLMIKYGFEGYGIYWAIIEDLYQNANALQMDYDSIAFALRSDSEKVKSVIEDFGLFVFENDTFGSLSVERRLNERNKKSKTARVTAFKRWGKDANGMPMHSERNANALKNDAIKESKGKDKKESKFIPPTLFEVVEYFSNNGYTTESANKAYEYYQVANWIDSKGNKVKNWKQKMQGVWFKDENKAKVKPGDKMVW